MELITEGKTSTTQRIESLQGLRTVLFLLIFAFHTSMIGNVTESTAYQSFFAGGGDGGCCVLLRSFRLC